MDVCVECAETARGLEYAVNLTKALDTPEVTINLPRHRWKCGDREEVVELWRSAQARVTAKVGANLGTWRIWEQSFKVRADGTGIQEPIFADNVFDLVVKLGDIGRGYVERAAAVDGPAPGAPGDPWAPKKKPVRPRF